MLCGVRVISVEVARASLDNSTSAHKCTRSVARKLCARSWCVCLVCCGFVCNVCWGDSSATQSHTQRGLEHTKHSNNHSGESLHVQPGGMLLEALKVPFRAQIDALGSRCDTQEHHNKRKNSTTPYHESFTKHEEVGCVKLRGKSAARMPARASHHALMTPHSGVATLHQTRKMYTTLKYS